jgi:hypothetical protein
VSDYDYVPVRALSEATEGKFMRFVGRVVAAEGELLTAPLTGRRCVAFDAAVFDYVLRFDSFAFHHPVEHSEPRLLTRTLRAMPFMVEDPTGRALVDPRGAFVRLTIDHRQGGSGSKITKVQVVDTSFLPHARPNEDKEYVEGVLEIGEEVVVTGLVQMPGAGDASLYRANADARLRIVGAADRPADVTDREHEVEQAGGTPVALRRLQAEREGARRMRQHVSGRMIIVPDE